jgi:hypothetical protein
VTSHVSHPYKSTDFTQALKILILVSFVVDVDSHTFNLIRRTGEMVCATLIDELACEIMALQL